MSQTIFRRARPSRYSVVGNDLINNPLLSMKAKGILIYLLSKPESWRAVVEDIVNHCTDGPTAVRSGLKELEECGYLRRECVRNEDGTVLRWEILVYEDPYHLDETDTTGGIPRSGLSTSGKSTSGKSTSGKPECIYSTDQQSTDQQSTDQQSKESIAVQVAKKSIKAQTGIPEFLDEVKAVYNQYKPDLWTSLRSWNDERIKLVNKWRKDYSDTEILSMLRDACLFVSQDHYWGSKDIAITTLFRKSNLADFADKWQVIQQSGSIIKALSDPKAVKAIQVDQMFERLKQKYEGDPDD